jgi:hypothetical protein
MPSPESFLGKVFPEELQAIAVARDLRTGGGPREHKDSTGAIERARKMRLFGLAFSGGGIRSATFNLGVLQALHQFGLLKDVDYLSTVSGGGYIGGWLSSWTKWKWTKREKCLPDLTGDDQPAQTVPPAGGESGNEPPPRRHEPREVFFLRRFSNYLAPRLGLLSADTLALVMTYLRNLLLNLLIVTSAITGVLLLLRWLAGVGKEWLNNRIPPPWPFLGLLAALCLVQASLIFGQLARADTPRSTTRWGIRLRRAAPLLIVLLLLVISVLLVRLATMQLEHRSWDEWGYLGAGCYSFACFVGWGIYRLRARWWTERQEAIRRDPTAIRNIIVMVLTAPVCGFLLGCLFDLFASGPVGYLDSYGLICLTPVLVLTAVAVVGFLHVGLAGRGLSDQMREWWSRMGAWHMVAVLSWTGAFFVTLLPNLDLLPSFREYVTSAKVVSGIVWLVSTLGGVWAAKSPKTGPGGNAPWLDIVAKGAPYVFILGLLVLLSYAAEYCCRDDGSLLDPSTKPLVVGVCVLIFSLFMSWRVDVNEFSMLSMYRNRLARCYLGASNPDRVPNATGFDPNDDKIRLSDLSSLPQVTDKVGGPAEPYVGPYLLVNTAINLVQASELAWQERKASSFVLTPHHCGYTGADLHDAYRPTPPWLGLSTAMAISGAAVSPNMGFHTSKATAFLLTVFNARLGRWFPNPRKEGVSSGPSLGLFYLLYELLGMTNDQRSYVYLSDGGHFENLGIYELLRRRCRYIIACDAGADPKYQCEDISRAISRARTDLGVDIDLDVDPVVSPQGSTKHSAHCVTGKITYPALDGNKDEGTILYLKASLTGDESPDIESYAATHGTFPHQTTADQFFEESQFESYRALGHHIATECLRRAGEKKNDADPNRAMRDSLEDLFTLLRQQWYPPLSMNASSSVQHSRFLDEIATEIRTAEHLRYLDYQLFPEWPALTGKKLDDRRTFWLPKDPKALREGFYVCSRVIQLMEDVYHDRDLENQSDHPDNSGWMNLFKHWTWSSMFRVTWTVIHSVHGVRFRTFCEKKLGLPVGMFTYADPVRVPIAVKLKLLNFLENRIVRRLRKDGLVRADDKVVPFHLVTTDPRDARRFITFTYGFAIVRTAPDGKALLYLRIQDHLRRLGLARQAVTGLYRSQNVRRTVPKEELLKVKRQSTRPSVGTPSDLDDELITQKSLEVLERLMESVRGEEEPPVTQSSGVRS